MPKYTKAEKEKRDRLQQRIMRGVVCREFDGDIPFLARPGDVQKAIKKATTPELQKLVDEMEERSAKKKKKKLAVGRLKTFIVDRSKEMKHVVEIKIKAKDKKSALKLAISGKGKIINGPLNYDLGPFRYKFNREC